MEHVKKVFPENSNIVYCQSSSEALENSDALLIVTEWDEFRSINF